MPTIHIKPLKHEFQKKGFGHQLLFRQGDVAVLRRQGTNHSQPHFEVAKVLKSSAWEVQGKKIPASEHLPNDEQYGTLGWVLTDWEAAVRRFKGAIYDWKMCDQALQQFTAAKNLTIVNLKQAEQLESFPLSEKFTRGGRVYQLCLKQGNAALYGHCDPKQDPEKFVANYALIVSDDIGTHGWNIQRWRTALDLFKSAIYDLKFWSSPLEVIWRNNIRFMPPSEWVLDREKWEAEHGTPAAAEALQQE